MPYDLNMQQEIISIPPIAATGEGATLTVADIGHWVPGAMPVDIRAVSFVVTLTCTVTPPVIDFYRLPDASNEAGRVLIARLTGLIGSWIEGNVIYKMVENVQIKPGEEIQCECSTAPTAGAGHACVLFTHSSANPASNTNMIVSTT